MNAENLQDALNYLDDDLIEETDALRRGERVIRRKPRVLQWAVPAACLVLVLGAGSFLSQSTGNTSNDAFYEGVADEAENIQNGSPEGDGKSQDYADFTWETVSCGTISLKLPEGWDYELTAGTDETQYICFGPAGDLALRVGYDPTFGVCGTDLTEKEISIAGMDVRAGYYGRASMWSFAVFQDLKQWYVIINEGDDDWWSAHGDLAHLVLDTITIDEQEG